MHFVLDRGRLLDLWEWAKQTGIRRLDVAVLDDLAFGDGVARPGRRGELRHDLLAVCDEMADDLDGQRLPIDFRPLTRIVDRLMRSEPLDQAYGERGGFAGLVPSAEAYPRAFFDSLDLRGALRPCRPRRGRGGEGGSGRPGGRAGLPGVLGTPRL